MDESGYDVRRALMNKPIQQDKDEKGGRDSKNRGKAEQMKKRRKVSQKYNENGFMPEWKPLTKPNI